MKLLQFTVARSLRTKDNILALAFLTFKRSSSESLRRDPKSCIHKQVI